MKLRKISLTTITFLLLFGAVMFGAQTEVAAAQVQKSTQKNAAGTVNTLSVRLGTGEVYKLDIPQDIKYSAYSWRWQQESGFSYSTNLFTFSDVIAEGCDHELDTRHYSRITEGKLPNSVYLKNNTAQTVELILLDTSEALSVAVSNLNSVELMSRAPGDGGYMNKASGASYTEIPESKFVTRAEWGADEGATTWSPRYKAPDKIIVHHTVTDSSTGDYANAVRQIFLLHTFTRGWGDIGYNYLIDPNGQIYEGRVGGEGVVGAHAGGSNIGSIGIAFIGDFTSKLPTQAAQDAFKLLSAERALVHGFSLNWGTTVTGHRDRPGNVTACPGNTLYPFLPTLIGQAESERVSLAAASDIDDARNAMLATLASYGDIRLELTFADEDITPTQINAALPRNSGLSVLSVSGNKAVVLIETDMNVNGVIEDSSLGMMKLLYLFFSQDEAISEINLLTNPSILRYLPTAGGIVLKTANITDYQFTFSRELIKGNGQINIVRRNNDQILQSYDVNNAAISISGRKVMVDVPSSVALNQEYYITICNTCLRDAGNTNFPGVSDETHWFLVKSATNNSSHYIGDVSGDLATYYPATSTFYVRTLGSASTTALQLGNSGIRPLGKSDYDGDGIHDAVVWDRQSSTWRVRNSASTNVSVTQFGWSEVNPVTGGDYDGDGKTDFAVYFPQTATWYVRYSASGHTISKQYGWRNAIPIEGGDYDGDGKTDFAIFDPVTAKWYIEYSDTRQVQVIEYGWAGATPIPRSDFDGDGITDLGIYDSSKSDWYMRNSSLGNTTYRQYGWMGAVPIWGNDYDGDGKTDLAVYSRGDAMWYIRSSLSGVVSGVQFGWSETQPVTR